MSRCLCTLHLVNQRLEIHSLVFFLNIQITMKILTAFLYCYTICSFVYCDGITAQWGVVTNHLLLRDSIWDASPSQPIKEKSYHFYVPTVCFNLIQFNLLLIISCIAHFVEFAEYTHSWNCSSRIKS